MKKSYTVYQGKKFTSPILMKKSYMGSREKIYKSKTNEKVLHGRLSEITQKVSGAEQKCLQIFISLVGSFHLRYKLPLYKDSDDHDDD